MTPGQLLDAYAEAPARLEETLMDTNGRGRNADVLTEAAVRAHQAFTRSRGFGTSRSNRIIARRSHARIRPRQRERGWRVILALPNYSSTRKPSTSCFSASGIGSFS
jgi:hypothetical protein